MGLKLYLGLRHFVLVQSHAQPYIYSISHFISNSSIITHKESQASIFFTFFLSRQSFASHPTFCIIYSHQNKIILFHIPWSISFLLVYTPVLEGVRNTHLPLRTKVHNLFAFLSFRFTPNAPFTLPLILLTIYLFVTP